VPPGTKTHGPRIGYHDLVPVTSDPSSRRYRIAALLSKGSAGRIYRAVVEQPDGSELDVAIKLLGEEELQAVSLERLKHEALRIAQIEDRAIVRVEPPIQLGDKWALVMDLVTGVSLQRLTSLGPMPVQVVAEILREVARVLHKVWASPGPDGRPLRILHRDLKPSNLQLNAGGELRVLDFGIAKADFRTRDAQTAAYATGTRAFVSPERVEGDDTIAGDVYSLGVTAHVLLGDDRGGSGRGDDPSTAPADAATQGMLALVSRMRSEEPKARPSAQEVERACAAILRRCSGESLREWAERNVPRAIAVRFSDRVVGTVLTAQGATGRARSTRPPASSAPRASAPRVEEPRARAARSVPPSTPPPRSRQSVESTPRSEPRSARSRRSEPPPSQRPEASATPPTTAAARSERPTTSLSSGGPTPGLSSGPPKRGSSSKAPDLPSSAPRSRPPAPTPATVSRTSAPPSSPPKATPATTARSLLSGDFTPPGGSRGRPMPAIAPAPLFPEKIHDAETVAADQASYMSLLEAEGVEPRAAGSPGTEKAAADPRGAASARAPAVGRRPPASPVRRGEPSRGRGWLVGVVATGLLATALVGGMSLVGAASAWWLWPDEPLALDATPVEDRNAGPGLMDDDEMLELLSQAPLPPPDGLRLTFNSVPLGADVYIDQRLVGQTPVIGVKVTEGTHEVTLLSDFERVTRTIEVSDRKPMRFVWRGGDAWEQHSKR
jgi:eukaryotic-like serine/threonine-protein kinase